MQETHLPNKKEWADRLEIQRRDKGIPRYKLAVKVVVSSPTLEKILAGNGTYEQLKAVEDALR
jgi:D-mannonate dehydratase